MSDKQHGTQPNAQQELQQPTQAGSEHLTAEVLQSLARGEVDSQRLVRLLAAHPLESCSVCREAYEAYERELERGHATALARMPDMVRRAQEERARGLDWVAQLRPMPQEERLARIRRARTRYRGEGFVRVLLTECRRVLPERAALSGEWAEAATAALAASGLERPEHAALAAAYRGNARRILGDLAGARSAFADCFRFVREHQDEVPVSTVAEILRLAATLFLYERDFDRAEEALQSASLAYLSVGQERDAAVVMMKLGILHQDRGQPERAIEIAQEALEHLDPSEDVRLYTMARGNLARHCYEAGWYDEARSILDEDAERFAAHPEPYFQLRLLLMKGRLAAVGGETESAEATFQQVRRAFAEEGSAFPFVEVSMDLALLYLEQGRTTEVPKLAGEMLQIFEAREAHPYAYGALRLFAEAARQGTVSAELVEKLTAYLDRAQRDPQAEFRGVN